MRPATVGALALAALAPAVPRKILAHCDARVGPLIIMAKAALERGDFARLPDVALPDVHQPSGWIDQREIGNDLAGFERWRFAMLGRCSGRLAQTRDLRYAGDPRIRLGQRQLKLYFAAGSQPPQQRFLFRAPTRGAESSSTCRSAVGTGAKPVKLRNGGSRAQPANAGGGACRSGVHERLRCATFSRPEYKHAAGGVGETGGA